MAKAPAIGVGKTRLGAEIGRVEAWRINRSLHARVTRQMISARWRTLLCVAPDRSRFARLPGVWPTILKRIGQGKGDLGERLGRALHGRRMVLVIGVDCPEINTRHIARAIAHLRDKPFVLGPAQDGGFWLLGARCGAAAAKAMSPVRWSTAHAAADVIANLGAGNVALIDTLSDIDDAADLACYRAQRAAKRTSRG